MVDGTGNRDDTAEDSEYDLEWDGDAADDDDDDDESASDDSESEKTNSARTSTILRWSRPILSLPFCITLSTTSSAGSSSSDLAKICRNEVSLSHPCQSQSRRGSPLTSPAPRITPIHCTGEMAESEESWTWRMGEGTAKRTVFL